jgi:hypothetical protein
VSPIAASTPMKYLAINVSKWLEKADINKQLNTTENNERNSKQCFHAPIEHLDGIKQSKFIHVKRRFETRSKE